MFAVPAVLAQDAPGRHQRFRPRGDHRHRAPPRGIAAGRADRGLGVLGRAHRERRRARHHLAAAVHAEPHPAGGARLELDADRLHPRHRPAGSAVGLRARRRPLCRRRLHRAPAGRGARHLRHRAPRSAARPAGHAVRPQHHRRRDQVRHQLARRRGAPRHQATRSAPTPSTTSSPRACCRSATRSRSARSAAIYRRDGYGENQYTGNRTTTPRTSTLSA